MRWPIYRSAYTAHILGIFLINPSIETFGYQIKVQTRLPSGVVYPTLNRLTTIGWLEAREENIDPHQAARPTRRYYRLTPRGQAEAPGYVAEVLRR